MQCMPSKAQVALKTDVRVVSQSRILQQLFGGHEPHFQNFLENPGAINQLTRQDMLMNQGKLHGVRGHQVMIFEGVVHWVEKTQCCLFQGLILIVF